MLLHYSLQVPDLKKFDAEYYFCDGAEATEKRVWPYHIHDKLELYILLEGDVSFVAESTLYKLSSGDALISRPNELHHCILNSGGIHRHLCFRFDASSEFIFGDFLDHDFGKGNLIVPSDEAKEELSGIYEKLRKASKENSEFDKLTLTLAMLGIFKKFMSRQNTVQQTPDIFKKILADIGGNFRDINSTRYFKEKYYLSASTLNRLFRNYLHTTPKAYLEAKKLAYSRFLLKNGKSVLDACMEAGFSDCSNYIRLFKKRFDMTPGEYKNS